MKKSEALVFLKNRDGVATKNLIKIPSEIKNIRKVSREILDALADYNLDEDRKFDLRLCIEEAVRNAITHGNNSDKKRFVKISYWVDGGQVNIDIEDEGKGFDHNIVPDPTAGGNLMKASGRGVYLIRKLMDGVEFNETGNKIRMIKNLKMGG